MSDTEKLLRELIALPSVNPALLPPGHPQAGEARVADFLAATAAQAGLDVDFQPALPGRRNFIATLAPRHKVKQRVLLAPHMDTVTGSEVQFHPRTYHGRLYGRGACDTKGSIAAMLTALVRLAKSGRRPDATEIVFAGLVDEEIGQGGSRALAASGFKAGLAVIGEPTRLQVVTAHKGVLWLELRTVGEAAHASCPELGSNAVHEMAQIVDLLETVYARQLRARPSHRLLGRATVNVGAILGGSQPNIVPASCQASVDRRTLPGETTQSVRAEVTALLRQRGLRAKIIPTQRSYCAPMETSPALPLVRQFLRAAGQTRRVGVNYFTDASVLARAGIPSVVFGPGDIAQAHTADEWISLRSLEKAAALTLHFLRTLS